MIDGSVFQPCACSLELRNAKVNGTDNFGLVRIGCFKYDKDSGVWSLKNTLLASCYESQTSGNSFYYSFGAPKYCGCNSCVSVWDCTAGGGQGAGVNGSVYTITNHATGKSSSCTTDSSGACCISLTGAQNGDLYDWSIVTPGGRNWGGQFNVICPGHNTVERFITGPNTITFQILNACDYHPPEPCPGATLNIQGNTYTADANGLVVINNMDGGDWNATVTCGIHVWSGVVHISCDSTQTIPINVVCQDCIVVVTVIGCDGKPLPGALVTVGGVGPVNTDANGQVTINNVPAGATQPITISCSRFVDLNDRIDMSNCVYSTTFYTGILQPANGYHCTSCGSPMPASDTLSLSDSTYGNTQINYDPPSGAWLGSSIGNYPGDACCPARQTQIDYTFINCHLTSRVRLGPSTPDYACPGMGPGGIGVGYDTTLEELMTGCGTGPGFLWEFDAPGYTCQPKPPDGRQPVAYPNNPAILITE